MAHMPGEPGALCRVRLRLPTIDEQGEITAVESLNFRKSSRCEALNQDGCVEVAQGNGHLVIRDSTAPNGAMLHLTPAAMRMAIGTRPVPRRSRATGPDRRPPVGPLTMVATQCLENCRKCSTQCFLPSGHTAYHSCTNHFVE
ncbi:DUF397 domain-containing protein [Spirillospora sp. CA-108201]